MWVSKETQGFKSHQLAAGLGAPPSLGLFSVGIRESGPGQRGRPRLSLQVYPIVDFPLREISLASQRGIAEHSAALGSRARVLQQVSGVGAWGHREGRLPGQLGLLGHCLSGHIKEERGCSLCREAPF